MLMGKIRCLNLTIYGRHNLAYNTPTLQNLIDRITADIKSRVVGGKTLLRRSTIGVLGRVYAGAVFLLFKYLEYQKNQLFAMTADGRHLDILGSEYGIVRNAPSKATGSGTATGTAGTSIPAGRELQASSGEVYIISASTAIGAGGDVTVLFTAKEAGADGNDVGGITLSFVSPLAGVNTSVTVDSDGISGGADQESDDDYRARILARKRRPPHGGAAFDYIAWMKEVSGVTRAWVLEEYLGAGTLGLAFVRDDDDVIIPNDTQKELVKAYVIEHEDEATGETIGCPVTAAPGLYMVDLSLMTVDMSISIYPNSSTVRANVQTAIEDLFLSAGGPGETLYKSEFSAVISAAVGEEFHKITSINGADDDLSVPTTRIPVLGTITWSDY
jgi:uncharacterized phage protein gp47/JayE